MEDTLFYHYLYFLKYLTKTDYRPKNWNVLRERMKKIDISTLDNIRLLKAAVVLGYHQNFDEKVISQLYKDFDETTQKRSIINSYLTLYHSIKLYKAELIPSSFNPTNYMDNSIVPTQFPLEGALYSAFGGNKYVKSRMLSKEAISIGE